MGRAHACAQHSGCCAALLLLLQWQLLSPSSAAQHACFHPQLPPSAAMHSRHPQPPCTAASTARATAGRLTQRCPPSTLSLLPAATGGGGWWRCPSTSGPPWRALQPSSSIWTSCCKPWTDEGGVCGGYTGDGGLPHGSQPAVSGWLSGSLEDEERCKPAGPWTDEGWQCGGMSEQARFHEWLGGKLGAALQLQARQLSCGTCGLALWHQCTKLVLTDTQ